jgi:hypothetical protein
MNPRQRNNTPSPEEDLTEEQAVQQQALQLMNQRKRRITTIVVVVLAVAAVGVWWAARKLSERNSAAKEEEIRAERADRAERELRMSVENMATKYNAVTNWVNLLGEQHPVRVFTIDVEEALKPTNGHPVLIEGRIENLAMRNGKYYVDIYDNPYNPRRPKIYYILQCDGDLANSIKKHRRDYQPPVPRLLHSVTLGRQPDRFMGSPFHAPLRARGLDDFLRYYRAVF